MERKKVFISYSWKEQAQVKEIADSLISNGIDVVIDIYDLKDGNDKYDFMEQCVKDDSINKVLMICDKSYCEKANNRDGGVGDEIVIISPEIYKDCKQDKFIAVVIEKDDDGKPYLPVFAKSRIYIDLSDEKYYEENYEKLLRDIYEKPLYKKPPLGNMPEFLEDESVNLFPLKNVIKRLRTDNSSNLRKTGILIQQCKTEINKAIKSYSIPNKTEKQDEAFLNTLSLTKELRDLFIDFIEILISLPIDISVVLPELFEDLYNELRTMKLINKLDEYLYDFLIMEFYIDTVAVLLYYKRYKEINDLITHTYYVEKTREPGFITEEKYFVFCKHINYIEDTCKPNWEKPNLYTLTGELLVNREKLPILTKKSISNADIILYQLGELLLETDHAPYLWFPTSYIYCGLYGFYKQLIWRKLSSKKYFEQIKYLFGINSVLELKELLSKESDINPIRYNSMADKAPRITSSISIDKIATEK